MEYNGRRMITLYLENDRPPRTWLKEIELVDVVWTSSPHTLNALARAGVPQDKLQAGGLIGYDADSFNLAVPAFETLPDGNPDFFTFLTVGAAQPRKGTDILLQAFSEEFKKDEPVQLIIKNYYYGQKRWVEAMLDDREGNHAPILHLYDTWDLTKLARYYKTVARHGAFVVPHRGEGFGLPQLEALACGCRLGTTDYGGPATNLRPEDPAANASLQSMVTLFPYRVVASTFHNNPQEPYYEKGEDPQWAEPDVAAVRAWMRRVYQEKYSEDDAQRAAQYVSQQFSMVERTKRFYELLKKL
jgi:glycosyltransferase involved in cell wall biosynthesis